MRRSNALLHVLLVMLSALVTAPAAMSAPTIVNGGFESGFVGWSIADQAGSTGSFFVQSGVSSPEMGDPVPAAPEGVNAAMSDAQGPGAHVLYQDFLAAAGPALLSFELFIGNRDPIGTFNDPGTLDFTTAAINMQARVDILAQGADPFSVAPADILMTLYTTQPGDPLVSGYNTISADLTALLGAHVGETLRLRFAETDNFFQFQLGVDDVRFNVPEPGSLGLAGLALVGLALRRRRR